MPARRRPPAERMLTVRGAAHNNLKRLDVHFPLGLFIVVTGVSGSGKTSLVNDILYRALARHFFRAGDRAGLHEGIDGLEHLDKVIAIDQSPIGRTPRSNPATYTNVFTHIRALMARTPEARMRGYKPGRFSFNVKGGRCEACKGDGQIKIEMHFLPDIYVTCEVCGGRRYGRETLAVRFKGLNIAEILDLTVEQARELFANVPAIARVLETLDDVGLGYIHLGQPATTLSGGEAQRVKLAKELCKRSTGRTLYLLDEPTTGLHFDDVGKLLGAAPSAGRQGQHGGGDRAQPGGDQDRRLDHRPGPRGRRGGRRAGGRGAAGEGRPQQDGPHRPVSRAGAEAGGGEDPLDNGRSPRGPAGSEPRGRASVGEPSCARCFRCVLGYSPLSCPPLGSRPASVVRWVGCGIMSR